MYIAMSRLKVVSGKETKFEGMWKTSHFHIFSLIKDSNNKIQNQIAAQSYGLKRVTKQNNYYFNLAQSCK